MQVKNEVKDRLVDANQAQVDFSALLHRVEEGGERIVIEKEGKAIVAIISYADWQRFEDWENRQDGLAIKKAINNHHQFLTLEEVIDSYNKTHETAFTLEEIVNEPDE